MKILHISSLSYGGAFRAAYRIHTALQKEGISSAFLSLDQIQDRLEYPVRKKNVFVQKFQWRMRHHFNIAFSKREKITHRFKQISQKLNCEIASIPVSDTTIHSLIELKQADIIHLHWVAGNFDYMDFFTRVKKPLVWTLHDMNPFSGLFHYDGDTRRNKPLSGKLNSYLTKYKARIINNFSSRLSVVAPSEWLAEKARQSNAFRKRPVSVVPNPIDLNEFSRKDTQALRAKLNISPDDFVLIAVAESTSNYRKGFDLSQEAGREFPELKLLLVGSKHPDAPDMPNVIYTGSIHDNALLATYYSLADATIIPSREDNLPNVMLESMACGTPVISFRVGGMLDHVTDYQTGLMADEMTAASLAQTIQNFIENKNRFDSSAIRRYAESHFNEKLIAEKYREVYNRCFL